MATVPSIRVVKTFPFKGGTRSFSNRYHFNGGIPANDTQWHALMDAVVTAEKAVYGSSVTIIEAWGYLAGSDVPVSQKNYSTAGTCSPPSAVAGTPGEVAALVRYSTAARSTKNHPVYLFNYYHGAFISTLTADVNILHTTQKSALDTYAGSWLSGFSDGAHTLVRAGPQGDAATGKFVEEYVTHRDFPYSRSA